MVHARGSRSVRKTPPKGALVTGKSIQFCRPTPDLGANPLARYFGLWMDGMVGPDFEEGLGRLKALSEAQPKVG